MPLAAWRATTGGAFTTCSTLALATVRTSTAA